MNYSSKLKAQSSKLDPESTVELHAFIFLRISYSISVSTSETLNYGYLSFQFPKILRRRPSNQSISYPASKMPN